MNKILIATTLLVLTSLSAQVDVHCEYEILDLKQETWYVIHGDIVDVETVSTIEGNEMVEVERYILESRGKHSFSYTANNRVNFIVDVRLGTVTKSNDTWDKPVIIKAKTVPLHDRN